MRPHLGRLASLAEILQIRPFLSDDGLSPWVLGSAGRAVIYYLQKTGSFSMRRRDFGSAVLVAAIMLVASPAFAQIPKLNLLQDKPGKTQEEKDAESAQDKAYRDSLKKIPDQKAPADPWGNVRSDAPSSSPAKSASSAKSKSKTGTSASGTSPN
jgi:hypothetical protein